MSNIILASTKASKSNVNVLGNAYDILKFMMSLLIVAIHSYAFEGIWFRDWIKPLNSIAVPVFFVLSSLFYFKKIRKVESYYPIFLHFLKRLLLLYLFWFIVNIPITQHTNQYFINCSDWINELWRLTLDLCVKGTYPGSWFFSTLAISIIIWSVSYKNVIVRHLLFVISFFLLSYFYWIQYLSTYLHGFQDWWFNNVSSHFEMSPFFALFWVGIGAHLSTPVYDRFIVYLKDKKIIVMPFVTILLVAILLINYNYGIPPLNYWLRIFVVISLIATTASSPIKPQSVYIKLRKISVLLFMTHFIFLWIAGVSVKHLWGYERLCDLVGYIPAYIITLLTCLSFSLIILNLSYHPKMKWLRYSY